MLQLFGGIKESQYVRLCVLLAFCCVTVLIFISLSPSEDSAPQPKLAKVSTMSEEIDNFPKAGGLGSVRAKDDEVTEVVNNIKPKFEEASGKKFESLEVLHYKTQVVAGTNFFVKAKAKEVDGPEQIVHLRIWRKLDRTLELTAHQLDRKVDEDVLYFQ